MAIGERFVDRHDHSRLPSPLADQPMLGLYLHIPFCSAICNYCNFNRGLFEPALKARYVDALVAEIARRQGDGRRQGARRAAAERADTIFFGGGTPSLLEPDEIARIIDACARRSTSPPTRSDARGESRDGDRPTRLRGLPARRASTASASACSRSATTSCGGCRGCTAPTGRRGAFARRARAGFDNVSLDLMMWLPRAAVAEWLESVDAAIALAPGSPVALHARGVSERAAARTTWRARAGRRRPTTTRRRCI